MKKLLLSMAVVAMLFSCSKDNVETETTADLSSTIATSTQEFSGVFGHHLNKALHGKIYVTVNGNDSQAQIELTDGNIIKFNGSQLNQDANTIYFSSNRGSFTFDALSENGARVSDLVIDNVNDAYIVTIESATRGGVWIVLGTYEEDGNPGFFGNWDMISDGVDFDFFGVAIGQSIAMTVITHLGTQAPRMDTTFEPNPLTSCVGDLAPCFADLNGDVASGQNPSVFIHGQSSVFKGPATTWGVELRRDLDPSGLSYVDDICTNIVPAGTWSWRNKTGTILVSAPSPAPIDSPAVSTRSSSFSFK